LRVYAQACAAQHGIDLTGGRVRLLCYPRLFGFTFNPLSVYFCHRADGELALVIYEVRNTFGDIHSYVLPVQPGELSEAGVRQQQAKLFYVSPFIEMTMRYHFRVSLPGERVKLRILETDREGPLLAATFIGRRESLTTTALLRSLFALPLVTLKIIAAIYWEALRLWLKGVRLMPRPHAAVVRTPRSTLTTSLATGKRGDYSHCALTDGPAHAEPDCCNPRQCGDGAFRFAPSGPVGAEVRLKTETWHARRDAARRPHAAVGRQRTGPVGGHEAL
jgi:DUF1365 family protein